MTQNNGYCNITNCQIPIRVRYSEVDRQNALHHSRYAVYFELGRTELLRQNGYDYKTLEDNGITLVLAHLACRFRSPAHYDDQLLLTTTCKKAKGVRLEHVYELVRPADNRLIAQGKTVLVHVDRQWKPQPLPDFLYPDPAAAAPKASP